MGEGKSDAPGPQRRASCMEALTQQSLVAYQCVLVAVVNHPSFFNGRAGSTRRLPHRLDHPHQRDVNTGTQDTQKSAPNIHLPHFVTSPMFPLPVVPLITTHSILVVVRGEGPRDATGLVRIVHGRLVRGVVLGAEVHGHLGVSAGAQHV